MTPIDRVDKALDAALEMTFPASDPVAVFVASKREALVMAGTILLAGAAVMALTACEEIPQDARKPFAGPEETKAYVGEPFKGDKAAYDRALELRAATQDDYERLRPEPK